MPGKLNELVEESQRAQRNLKETERLISLFGPNQSESSGREGEPSLDLPWAKLHHTRVIKNTRQKIIDLLEV